MANRVKAPLKSKGGHAKYFVQCLPEFFHITNSCRSQINQLMFMSKALVCTYSAVLSEMYCISIKEKIIWTGLSLLHPTVSCR